MKDYDFIDDYSDGFACVRLNSKWGFIDKNGNEICEIKYDFVFDFNKCYALIITGGCYYGYINTAGVEVVECKYSSTVAHELLKKYEYNQKRIDKIKTII